VVINVFIVSAADAKVVVNGQFFTRPVHAVFNRTSRDTGITIYTFFFMSIAVHRVPLSLPPPIYTKGNRKKIKNLLIS